MIVIMLDRAMGTYIPFIMNERPELAEKFSGFVYYPNTISFGGNTVLGAPALFGGYEYSTEAIDDRDDERLADKHDEVLKIMPVLFSENGYNTTVYDPPLAGYDWVGDPSIYNDYPNIDAYNLEGQFIDADIIPVIEKYRRRAFFMYSIHKSVPLICQMAVYDEGRYHYPDKLTYPDERFINSYSVLENMEELTQIDESDRDNFMMMCNNITHWGIELQFPDYEMSMNTNNRGLDNGYRTDAGGRTIKIDGYYHYHAYMAAMIKLGKYFDYLRENGVYDNTRVVITSDHGYNLGDFEDLILEDGTDLELVIPLLMYKDFDSDTFSVSDEFMTNADTSILAMGGLIDNPINPFTGNKIDDKEKKSHDQEVLCLPGFELYKDRNVFYEPGQPWYSVHDNVYDRSNWTRIDPERHN